MTIIHILKNFFSGSKSLKRWQDKLIALGFDKIAFPILIKDGTDLNLVYFDEFSIDPDIHYWEFKSNYELIDSNGQLWLWKYDHTEKTNLPGRFIRTMTYDEVKSIINTYFKNSKIKNDIQLLTDNATSIHNLFEKLQGKF